MSQEKSFPWSAAQPPHSEASPRIGLLDDESLGQVQVDIETFIVFNDWMNEQLGSLEESFTHFQTPKMSSRRQHFGA